MHLANATEYSSEMQEAYNRAYENWIIFETPIDNATLYDTMPNPELRDILLRFADYLWLDTDSIQNSFGDLFSDEGSYANRANFATALSKILWGDLYDWGNPYYKNHLEALKAAGIITVIENPEERPEIKGYVLIMLKSVAENYSKDTDCEDKLVKKICSEPNTTAYKSCPEICRPNGILTNKITKTVEFNTNEVSKKVVFNGTYTALKDSTIKRFSLEHNDIDQKNCYKNISFNDIIFKLYINWEVVGSTLNPNDNGMVLNSCQFFWALNLNEPINLKKWDSIQIKLEWELDSDAFWNNNKEYDFSIKLSFYDTDREDAIWVSEYLAPIKIIDTSKKCEPMKNPNIYHTIKNDTITLGWDDIKWDNMEISIYDPVNDIYKSLGTAKMSDKNFTYKIKWDWEQNFKFSNGCSEYYYKVTTKCDWMKYASISHTVKNDTITFNWNAIEWDTVEISIFDPIKETYKKLETIKMNNEEFSYKIKWEWEQNFKFSNGCDNYYYKVNVSLNDKDSVKLDWNLVNNIKKTVEFKSYEVSKKVVFSGIYTALNDTTINYYWIETKYDESKGNNYINERCKKNTTDMTFYVYIDWKMIDRTPQTNSCSLAQGAWFGKRIDEITLKKWETKNIKVEIEMSWSVKEEDIYNFELSLNNVDKNNRDFEKWKVKADFNIKILNNDKDSVNLNIEKEKNQNNKGITTVKKSDWDPSDILSNWYTRELNDAYQFAHENWITTTKNIGKAKMNSPLTRIAMAKMLSNYAINILWKQPDTSKWIIKFNDVTNKQNSDYGNAVTIAYQLWIMWQNMKNNNFRPNDEVTRAEFATALSRMLYNTEDWKWNAKYYDPHIAKLYDEWIITYTNPKTEEKRWYVMIMLMRTAE